MTGVQTCALPIYANGFKTMFDDGVVKALRGDTTLEEILRVTQK